MQESTLRRAWNDTISAQKTIRFTWLGNGGLGVAGGVLLPILATDDAAPVELVPFVVGGGLLGLASAFVLIYLYYLARAPYRQRDEARAQIATVNNRDSVDTNSRNFGVIVDPKVIYLTLTSRKQKYDDPMEISVHVKFAVTAPVLLHKLELVFSRDGHQIEYRSEVTGGSEGAPNLPNLPVTLKQTATYSVAFEMTWSRLIGSPFVNLRAFTGDHECLSNEFRLKESEQEFDFTQSN